MIGSQSSSEYKPSSRAKNSVNLYNKVLHYSKLTATPDMKKHQQILKKFIQFSDQRALFVFGPSGSGKRTFINSYFNRYKVPFVWVNQQVCFNTQDMDEEWPDDGQMQLNKKVTSIRQLITKSVSKSDTHIVQIYSDFPFPNSDSNIRELQLIKTFKQNFFKNLRASGCKIIFILNSQIYNRYFIVPKDCPSCISQFTLKPYTSTEVKTILKQFVKEHTVFQWIIKSKDNLDEVIEVSNGDMRKVLLNVLKITMDGSSTKMENMNKQQKSEYKMKLKNEQKFPLFHMLGKYLYAKRYDPIQKKDRVFTRQQLMKSDPPFYFNPVDLYYKSTVPLNTFTDLLFENYTAKVGRIQDVKQIATLFCALDTIFPAFITNKKIDSINEQMQELYICMLTWGIILKNKSSASLEKRFASFRKSQAKYIANQIQAKKTLFKTYFPYSRRQNLIRWGYIVKNSKPSKKYLISDLIRKRSRMMNVLRQDNERAMGQEQEQQLMKMQTNGCQDFLKSYNQKKQKKEKQDMILKEMLEQQESDIDQENQC